MPKSPELVEQVREVMANTFGVDENELPENVSQQNFSRWSSLYHMTLLYALEEEFNLTLSMAEMTAMTSLDSIVKVLSNHQVGVK